MRLASEPPTVKFGLTEEQRKQLHFDHIAISEKAIKEGRGKVAKGEVSNEEATNSVLRIVKEKTQDLLKRNNITMNELFKIRDEAKIKKW